MSHPGHRLHGIHPRPDDILHAMRELEGYFDITPEDFEAIYRHAYRHARSHEPTAPTPQRHAPAGVGLREVLWSWLGAFLGIGSIGLIQWLLPSVQDGAYLLGSFGASAVLVYGAVKSPLAQPRNLIGGHVLSGLVGWACWAFLPLPTAVVAGIAVATAIGVMHLTRTLHPPGGATALIAVIGSEHIHRLGVLYAFFPAGAGALILLGVALVVNNLARGRSYPEYWV